VKLLVAALVVTLPLAWIAEPLMDEKGATAVGLRFERDLQTFGAKEGEIVRRQTEILTFPPNVRVNRLELAERLRTEVLAPWREASRPLLEGATLPLDGSPGARRQQVIRDYLRARSSAIELRAVWLESGDANDEARAVQAERQLGKTLDAVNAL
jgi:hypothetical protein